MWVIVEFFYFIIVIMYFLIVLLPLIGSCLVGLGGRWIGRMGSAYLSTFILFLTWLLAILGFYEVCLYSNIVSVPLYT